MYRVQEHTRSREKEDNARADYSREISRIFIKIKKAYLARRWNGIAQTMIRAHGAQWLAATSVTQSGRDAGRCRRWWISRSLQRRAIHLVHGWNRQERTHNVNELANKISERTSLLGRFIYRFMYRVRSTSRHSVISYDVGYLVCSTYAVECVKCGRLKSARWSYDCAST